MNKFNFQIITKGFDMAEYKIYLQNLITVTVESSADVFQLRNKYLTSRDIYSAALYARNILDEFPPDRRPLFIVNDRPDIAYIAKADGVHMGQDDVPLEMVKKTISRVNYRHKRPHLKTSYDSPRQRSRLYRNRARLCNII